MKNKALYIGILFIALGSLFIFLENRFYQYVDEHGFLHESLFMPLGALSLFLGFIGILISIIIKIRNSAK